MKGKEMTSLRHRVMAAVSALVILVALVILPGCRKSSSTSTTTKTTTKTTKKTPDTGME